MQHNYLQDENENSTGTLQQLAKRFCQYVIKQSELKGTFSKYCFFNLFISPTPGAFRLWQLKGVLRYAENIECGEHVSPI